MLFINRESIDETIALEPLLESGLTGVFHCFTGTLQQTEKIISMGVLYRNMALHLKRRSG